MAFFFTISLNFRVILSTRFSRVFENREKEKGELMTYAWTFDHWDYRVQWNSLKFYCSLPARQSLIKTLCFAVFFDFLYLFDCCHYLFNAQLTFITTLSFFFPLFSFCHIVSKFEKKKIYRLRTLRALLIDWPQRPSEREKCLKLTWKTCIFK